MKSPIVAAVLGFVSFSTLCSAVPGPQLDDGMPNIVTLTTTLLGSSISGAASPSQTWSHPADTSSGAPVRPVDFVVPDTNIAVHVQFPKGNKLLDPSILSEVFHKLENNTESAVFRSGGNTVDDAVSAVVNSVGNEFDSLQARIFPPVVLNATQTVMNRFAVIKSLKALEVFTAAQVPPLFYPMRFQFSVNARTGIYGFIKSQS
ncbi:MAG: hypothetical protein LQ351_005070 [Letrouitia transgressa]|nr:MAG: hypothetical protein LQ351_005070 [Letrouitia transgressa]